jgi:alpha-tubulin suppressor-like RCC1 family protein
MFSVGRLMMKIGRYRWTVVAVLCSMVGLTTGCLQFSINASSSPPSGDAASETTPAVAVVVVGASGDALEGVDVSAGEETAKTDARGEALLDELSAGRTVVRATADGYVPGTTVVQVGQQATIRARIQLHEGETNQQIPISSGGEVSHRGYTVSLPKNAVADAEGNPVEGTFDVELTPIRPADGDVLPGPTDSVRAADGSAPEAIALLSLAHIDLRRDGEPLQIRDGKSIRVEHPLPDGADRAVDEGDTVDAYWYDESSGEWVRDGLGAVEARSDGDGLKWVADLDHLTYYGSGLVPTNETCVQVEVLDRQGSPVPNATITSDAGVDRPGWTRTLGTTGSDGNTCVRLFQNYRMQVTVTPPGGSDLSTATRTLAGSSAPAKCGGISGQCSERTIRYRQDTEPDTGMADTGDVGDTAPLDTSSRDTGTVDTRSGDTGVADPDSSDMSPRDTGGTDADGSDASDTGVAVGSATQVAAGEYHTCALETSGDVECWGLNRYGQLGDGTRNIAETPVSTRALSSAVDLASGKALNCVALSGGGAKCWGKNRYGGVGDGTRTIRETPTSVKNLSSAVDVAVGGNHACAVLNSGAVKCWGLNNYGQLGDGSRDNSNLPVSVRGITSATDIVASREFTCALLQNSEVRCWGLNRYGQVGDGSTTVRETPTPVQGISDATAIAAGKAHACAVSNAGTMKCWGLNRYSQLGDGTTDVQHTPVAVQGISSAEGVVAGKQHTCARLTSGEAWCWGLNRYGQIGVDSPNVVRSPTSVQNLSDVASLGVGFEHSCAVLDSGGVRCWGVNRYGALGDGSRSQSATPVAVQF